MLVVENSIPEPKLDYIDYSTESTDSLVNKYFSDINSLDSLVLDLQVKNHALNELGALYNNINEKDDEHLKLYVASEAMEYARLAGVANEITYGNEGVLDFIYKIITSIFKAIMSLLKKIISFIKNIFNYIMGFFDKRVSSSSRVEKEKEKVEKEFDKLTDDIVDIVNSKKDPGTPLSDQFLQAQKEKIKKLEKEVVEKANNLKYLKVFDIDAKDGVIDASKVLLGYRFYVSGVNRLSSFMNRKYSFLLNFMLFDYVKKNDNINKPINIILVAKRYMEYIKEYDKGMRILLKNNATNRKALNDEDRKEFEKANNKMNDIVNTLDSPYITSFRTLVTQIYREVFSMVEEQYDRTKTYIDVENVSVKGPSAMRGLGHLNKFLKDANFMLMARAISAIFREDILKDLHISKNENRALLGSANNRIFAIETLESDRRKLRKMDKELKDDITKLKDMIESNKVNIDTCLMEAAKILDKMIKGGLPKLTSASISDLSSVDKIVFKSVSTDDLDRVGYDIKDVRSRLAEVKYNFLKQYVYLLEFSKNTNYVKEDLKQKQKRLEQYKNDLIDMEKTIKNDLKALNENHRDMAGKIIGKILSAVNTATTVYANNVKELSKVEVMSVLAYRESKFYALIKDILNLYKEKLLIRDITNLGL